MFGESLSESKRSSYIDDEFCSMCCRTAMLVPKYSFRENFFFHHNSRALELVRILQKRSLALCKQRDYFHIGVNIRPAA